MVSWKLQHLYSVHANLLDWYRIYLGATTTIDSLLANSYQDCIPTLHKCTSCESQSTKVKFRLKKENRVGTFPDFATLRNYAS